MIRKQTTNEPVINMNNFFNLDESVCEYRTPDEEPSSTPDGWKSPLDLDLFPSSLTIENDSQYDIRESVSKRGNHAKEDSSYRLEGNHAAVKGSHIDHSVVSQTASFAKSNEDTSGVDTLQETSERPINSLTRSSLRSSVERAEEMSSVLAETLVELSRKTESAEAIVRSIEEVANEAIMRVESSVRKSLDTLPLSTSNSSFNPRDLEKLEERLATMLTEEYKRHAQALASVAATQSGSDDLKNSELWDALTSYISEKMDALSTELERKGIQQTTSQEFPQNASGDKKSLEERFLMLEKQYRKNRKSTIALGSCFFVSMAAIAVSLGSGMSFQQIVSVITGG